MVLRAKTRKTLVFGSLGVKGECQIRYIHVGLLLKLFQDFQKKCVPALFVFFAGVLNAPTNDSRDDLYILLADH